VKRRATIICLFGAALLLAPEANARRGVPVANYDNVLVVRPDGKTLASSKVREAIVMAALQHRWTVLEDNPGTLVTNLNIRGKHSMSVEIRYAAHNFSINYRDSSNLNYGKGEHGTDIHPTYNKEVKKLLDAINAALQRV
jgi:hypothetical protein